MNDGWYESLTKIKQNASEDAIINSWWDFGHWFKAVGDRAVTFDGTPQEFGEILREKEYIEDKVNIAFRGLRPIRDEGRDMRKLFEYRQEIILAASERVIKYLESQEPNESGDFVRQDYFGTNFYAETGLDNFVMKFGKLGRSLMEKISPESWHIRFHELSKDGVTKSILVLDTTYGMEPLLYVHEPLLGQDSVLQRAYEEVVVPYRRELTKGNPIILQNAAFSGTIKVHVCGPKAPFNGVPLSLAEGLILRVLARAERYNGPPFKRPEILEQDLANFGLK